MLTRTSVTAVRILLHLSRKAAEKVTSLKQVSNVLGESPTYLAKIARHLVRAGLLGARRGKAGGVVLGRAPESVSLLAIVEACQGKIPADFCQNADVTKTCAMHQAGAELYKASIGVLTRWTLADFIRRPCPAGTLRGKVACLLEGGRPGRSAPARKGRR